MQFILVMNFQYNFSSLSHDLLIVLTTVVLFPIFVKTLMKRPVVILNGNLL